MFQLYVKIIFLNSDLEEVIYMEQSRGYVAQSEYRMQAQEGYLGTLA